MIGTTSIQVLHMITLLLKDLRVLMMIPHNGGVRKSLMMSKQNLSISKVSTITVWAAHKQLSIRVMSRCLVLQDIMMIQLRVEQNLIILGDLRLLGKYLQDPQSLTALVIALNMLQELMKDR